MLAVESFELRLPRPADPRRWAEALAAGFAERGWRVIRCAVVAVEQDELVIEGARLCAS